MAAFVFAIITVIGFVGSLIAIYEFFTHFHGTTRKKRVGIIIFFIVSILLLALFVMNLSAVSKGGYQNPNPSPTVMNSVPKQPLTSTAPPTPTTVGTTPTFSSGSPSASRPLRVYDFEDGLQSWEFVSTQPSDKPSHFQPTKSLGYNSYGSLELDTNLWGTGNATIPHAGDDNYSHTAIRVFFHNQNYLGKKVNCQLYIPDPVPTGIYFRLFVISDKQDTDSYEYGKDKLHTEGLAANTWTELSMVIGDPQNEDDTQFDPGHVNYIGLTVQADGGADMGETSVKVFVDNCTVA